MGDGDRRFVMVPVLISLLVVVWGMFLIGGTAYLVIVYGWSCWWFVLSVLLLIGTKAETGSG